MTASLEDVTTSQQHREMLYPTVRIQSGNAWGSGTVIYSKPDRKGVYHTYVATCEHVVDDLIKVEKKWDSVLKVDRRTEILGRPAVQMFYYEHLSRCKGSSGEHRAEIVAYDKDEDIAILEVERKELPIDFVAFLYPENEIPKIHVLDELFCVGAAMAHEPIMTVGHLNFMDEIIDGKEYWMSSAASIFGNSGGTVYRYSPERKRYELLGMPARITVSFSGFSASPITHMGFFVPITRIFELLKKNNLEFISDITKTYEECMEERRKVQERERRLVMARIGEVEEDQPKKQVEEKQPQPHP